MTAATFRLPGPLAISVAQVDQMSGGRVELGHRRRLVRGRAHRVRHPVPAAGRALRPLRGAARGHHRPVGDAAGGAVRLRRHATTGSWTRRRCPSRCSDRARRSSSAAQGKKRTPRAGRPLRRRVQPAASPPSRTPRGQFDRVRAACAGRRPRPGVDRLAPDALVLCVRPGRGRARAGAPRPSAATSDELRENGARRDAGRGRRHPRPVRRGRRRSASTCRCSTSPTSTTCELVAQEVMPHV